MKSDARWMTNLAIRVLTKITIGSLLTAATGAILLAKVGAIVGAFMPEPLWFTANRECGSYLCDFKTGNYGAMTGTICGTILGLVIFSTATINDAQMRKGLSVFTNLCARVILGQCAGVCSFALSYLVMIYGASQIQNHPFGELISVYFDGFLFGAPALMICGVIAGALIKRDLPQSATLNAE